MAFTGGALVTIYSAIQTGGNVNWHSVLIGSAAAGIGYIIQKFFTTSSGAAYGIPATVPKPSLDTTPLA